MCGSGLDGIRAPGGRQMERLTKKVVLWQRQQWGQWRQEQRRQQQRRRQGGRAFSQVCGAPGRDAHEVLDGVGGPGSLPIEEGRLVQLRHRLLRKAAAEEAGVRW